jgi:PhzF family phenazine biosynthesis protein
MASDTRERRYRILNVFSVEGQRLSGNPLCVFEDGRGLEDAVLQALARQLNLSETTFILPPRAAGADAHVRIFTPTFEMPFAGHPTLGTAHVVAALGAGSEPRAQVTLEMKAGLVEVRREGARWTLRTARGPETTAPTATNAELAAMLGLDAAALAGDPLWVDTGSDQLVIPLRSAADVAKASPAPDLLRKHATSARRGASMAYVWAPAEAASDRELVVRFFFLSHGSVIEDPATGSACANLGGFLLVTGRPLPFAVRLSQGEGVARPSRLELRVDADEKIFVGGRVEELGGGSFVL